MFWPFFLACGYIITKQFNLQLYDWQSFTHSDLFLLHVPQTSPFSAPHRTESWEMPSQLSPLTSKCSISWDTGPQTKPCIRITWEHRDSLDPPQGDLIQNIQGSIRNLHFSKCPQEGSTRTNWAGLYQSLTPQSLGRQDRLGHSWAGEERVCWRPLHVVWEARRGKDTADQLPHLTCIVYPFSDSQVIKYSKIH